MIVLELFAGTRSIGKEFEAQGHKVISIDYDTQFENIDAYMDIEELSMSKIYELCGEQFPDLIWASFDCTTYSIAGISHHRLKAKDTLLPISEYARKCDRVNKNVLRLIKEIQERFNPKLLYFIENPRGGLRKMDFMQELPRYSLCYCKYELDKPVDQRRMKPTDIWTNHPNPNFLPMCHNGNHDHASAPRGSQTGTQGIKGAKLRSVIPPLLCKYIVAISEDYWRGIYD